MKTSQHELDDLVRRLSPVRDTDLATALDDRAAEAFARDITNQSGHSEQSVAVDRAGSWRRRFAPALAAASVVLFAALALTLLPLGSSQPAIAGWGPEPSAPKPELLDAAAIECPPPLEAEPSEQLFSFMASDPPIVGVDLRGNAASTVFADDEQYYACTLVEVDGNWEFSAGLHGGSSGAAEPIDADREHHWTYGEMNLTKVVGHIDGTVDRVAIQLADGTQLEATTGDGVFVAWWPSTVPFARASAYDANGVEVGTDDAAVTTGSVTVLEDDGPHR